MYYAVDVTYKTTPKFLWAIGPTTNGLAEIGLEVVVPTKGDVLPDVDIVASGVEERLGAQQPKLHVGQRRPIVAHLVLEPARNLARVHMLSIRLFAGVETDRQPSPRARSGRVRRAGRDSEESATSTPTGSGAFPLNTGNGTSTREWP